MSDKIKIHTCTVVDIEIGVFMIPVSDRIELIGVLCTCYGLRSCGLVVAAIKRWRQYSEWGLRDAKLLVDELGQIDPVEFYDALKSISSTLDS